MSRYGELVSPILRRNAHGRLGFCCPGCQHTHYVTVEGTGSPSWGWNGNYEAPTFTPSLLVTYNGPDAGKEGAPPAICHSFVTDGRIQFLGDCTHELAGQTVPIPEFDR